MQRHAADRRNGEIDQDRFVGLGVVTLQEPEIAVREAASVEAALDGAPIVTLVTRARQPFPSRMYFSA